MAHEVREREGKTFAYFSKPGLFDRGLGGVQEGWGVGAGSKTHPYERVQPSYCGG